MEDFKYSFLQRAKNPSFSPLVRGIGYSTHDCLRISGETRNTITVNFGVVLNAPGGMTGYEINGVRYEVRTPAVIFRHPYAKYRVSAESEKLYWAYSAEDIGYFEFFRARQEYVIQHVDFTPKLNRILSELFHCCRNIQSNGSVECISLKCLEFVMEYRNFLQMGTGPDSADMRSIRNAGMYLSAHFRDRVDIKELSRKCGMSYRNFIRYFIREFGMPPIRYQMCLRLEEAKRLLVETDARIGQISELAGFGDPYFFSKFFKRESGMAPGAFRKQHEKFSAPTPSSFLG